MKKLCNFILCLLITTRISAQTVIGGGHEIPKVAHPETDKIRLPPIFDINNYIPRENVGLTTNQSDESIELQKTRIMRIIDTFNYLKQVDLNCSVKNQQEAIFRGARTIQEIHERWSTYAALSQITKGLEALVPCDTCQCTSPAYALKCISDDKVLETMLKKNILSSVTLEEDLNIIHEVNLKHNLSKNKNYPIDPPIKKLIFELYSN